MWSSSLAGNALRQSARGEYILTEVVGAVPARMEFQIHIGLKLSSIFMKGIHILFGIFFQRDGYIVV